MQKSLKHVRDTLYSIQWLKERNEYHSKELIRLGGEKLYQQTNVFYDKVVNQLEEEIKELPIGYRYTGAYYLKKPYSYAMPAEFEKFEGSIFMREDLVSWQREKDDGSLDYTYYRTIYKTADVNGKIITREDAVPVYKREN